MKIASNVELMLNIIKTGAAAAYVDEYNKVTNSYAVPESNAKIGSKNNKRYLKDCDIYF